MNLWKTWELLRDVGLTGLGAWVVYKQVYSLHPNDLLLATAATLIAPAGINAFVALLWGPGSGASSSSPARHAASSRRRSSGPGEQPDE